MEMENISILNTNSPVTEFTENEKDRESKVFDLMGISNTKLIPYTPQELTIFIRDNITILKIVKTALTSGKLPPNEFEDYLRQAQELGDKILDAKVELGNILIKTPSAQGKRTDLIGETNLVPVGNEVKSKKEMAIHLNLSSKQASNYTLLATNKDIVKQVKDEARKTKDIPSESAVLKKISDIKYPKHKARSEIMDSSWRERERMRIVRQRVMKEIDLIGDNKINWEAVELNPPTIVSMDCISFFDWCPSYDLMLTNAPNYEEMNPSTWVSVALSKMKPTGSAYILMSGKPDELKAFLNAPIPDGVRLEDIHIWADKGYRHYPNCGEKYRNNYNDNYRYKIFYYRGKESRELNEPCVIKDVVNFFNKKNVANDSLYIVQSSNEGDIVVDPFGNESILFRASKLGRKVYGAIYEDIKNEDDLDKSKISFFLTTKFCKLGDVQDSKIHELLSTKLKKAS